MAKEYLTVNGRLITVDGRLVQVPDSENLNDLADENGAYARQGTLLADDIIELIANGVVDGSPRAVYNSLTDLQTAYPNGANGVYLTSDNGHWYYWNGTAWTDGGAYCTNEAFKGYSVLVIDNDGNVVRHFIDDTIGGILSNYDSSVGTAVAVGNYNYPILLRGNDLRPKYSYGDGVKEIALLEDLSNSIIFYSTTLPTSYTTDTNFYQFLLTDMPDMSNLIGKKIRIKLGNDYFTIDGYANYLYGSAINNSVQLIVCYNTSTLIGIEIIKGALRVANNSVTSSFIDIFKGAPLIITVE